MTSLLVQRYQKARDACALFHLENWGIISVSGPDARDFLQRLGTQDIRNLTPQSATQSLFLKGDGRLAADSIIMCSEPETWLLLVPGACHKSLIELLNQYHFAEKLSITDISTDYYAAMLSGPRRADVLSATSKTCTDAGASCLSIEVVIAPSSPRSLFLVPAKEFSEIRGAVYEAVESIEGVIGGADLFETLRVEEGMPIYGADLSEKIIPLESSQKSAISFTKGCFPGQEIVARINNLGHPANVLVGLSLPESTKSLVGHELHVDGKAVGRITSVAFSPRIKGEMGLGYVKWSQREAGTELMIDGDEQLKANVIAIPLPGLELK